jgi:hypothetical protein
MTPDADPLTDRAKHDLAYPEHLFALLIAVH